MPVANINCDISTLILGENVKPAAIDRQVGPRDKTRFARREKTYRCRNILRLADSALDFLNPALDVGIVPQHRRIDSAGRDTVDADFVTGKLLAEASGECFHAAF